MNNAKNVLLTGARRGIGAAIRSALTDDNFYTLICPTREELELADADSIWHFLSGMSSIDIIINNAGINILKGIHEIDEDSIEKMLNVNLVAPLKLIASLSSNMKNNQWGRIINISSIWGLTSKERRVLYSMTKFGLNGITKSLAKELGPYNILVNSVCPGYVDTELTKNNILPADQQKIKETIPLGRFAQPQEIARLVKFLISDDNTYITGQTIVIDGGFL
jgi:3-oxoacyl-[acyl-carrier protein] reductase